MVKLLPTAFGSLGDPCLPDLFTKDYPPLPGVIMMGSLFCLFVMEMYLDGKTGGHSHGGPTGNVDYARSIPPSTVSSKLESEHKASSNDEFDPMTLPCVYNKPEYHIDRSTMPTWFVAFYEQYVRQHCEIMETISRNDQKIKPTRNSSENISPIMDTESAIDEAMYRKMSTNITLLEGGILFHSVFVGMTVSITVDGFVTLLIAILFHQMFEGLGLGSRIAAVPYPKGSIRPWLLVFAFGATAPIGQAIGLLTRNTYDPNSAFGLIIVGVFNAM